LIIWLFLIYIYFYFVFKKVAPAHNSNDFALGKKLGLESNDFVDEKGCYIGDLGPDYFGKSILKGECD
jgi:isoleucyl-tRNA synthetase